MSVSNLLSNEDRRRLREIVLRVHLRHYPNHMLTNYEADKLIDSFAEDVIEDTLKAGIAAGVK